MPGYVFISYRREDTAGYAGRLYDRLKAAFPGRVFIDVGEILPGADFVQTIEQHIAGCAALIALIGANWTAHDRLQDPSRLRAAGNRKRTETPHHRHPGAGRQERNCRLPRRCPKTSSPCCDIRPFPSATRIGTTAASG